MNRNCEERPDPTALLRQLSGDGRRRAMLRVYLGYATGSGTTTAMLDEARRRRARGTDVVVGAYRVHGGPAKALSDLPVLGTWSPPAAQKLDLTATLARNPEVVCVDDLAGVDSVGQIVLAAVPRLLAAGITVLATLHVLSIRSEAEAVAGMLGRPLPGRVLDDAVLEMIDELEVIDIPPADLLTRIREEGILTPAQLAVAMQGEVRPAVLELLREAVLRIIAEHSDRQLAGLLGDPNGQPAPEVRGGIVLCLGPQKGLEDRIRWTAKYAAAHDVKFSVVTVRTRNLTDSQKIALGAYAALTHQLHGEFVSLHGRNIAATLARFIQDSQAAEVILGHRRRSRWLPWDTTSELIRLLEKVDVHILRSTPPPVPPVRSVPPRTSSVDSTGQQRVGAVPDPAKTPSSVGSAPSSRDGEMPVPQAAREPEQR